MRIIRLSASICVSPAKEAVAAALAFKVGPAAHEAAGLVVEVRQLDLEAALGGRCTLPENLQDQARPVDHLALELFLKRTLLNGRKCAVDDDQFGFGQFGIGADLFDLPRPEQGRRAHVAYRLDIAFGHHDADGIGQADGLGQALFGGQVVRLSANVGANHEGARAARHLAFKFIFENLE